VLQQIGAPAGEPPQRARDWEHYGWLRDQVSLRYGFWAVAGGLLVVGMTNVALAVPAPPRP
jgi:hypothetical protein